MNMIDSGILRLAKFEEAKDYWLERLQGELCQTVLPSLEPGEDSNLIQEARLPIPEAFSQKLNQMANGQDVGIFVILLSVVKIWLHALTGTKDSIVVTPVLAKSKQQYNQWLVLRDAVESSGSFKDFLGEVKQTLSSAIRYQYYPLEKLLELLDIGSDPSLFRVVFSMDHLHRDWAGADLPENQKNDMAVRLINDNGALSIQFTFNSTNMEEAIWSLLQASLLDILQQSLDNLDIPIKDILWVNNKESLEIHSRFAKPENSGKTADGNPLLHQLLEGKAADHPHRIALQVIDQNGTPTDIEYGRLNYLAANLAKTLSTRGVKTGDVVAFLLADPLEVAVSIFAILKAGGAYLPIEPNYPPSRISFMLEDASARLLITTKESQVTVSAAERLFYEDISLESSTADKVNLLVAPTDPAYVIYTSGTTGVPKGVMVEHCCVMAKLLARRDEYQMDEACVALQLFSHAFDGFVTSFFTPIAAGGRVVLLPPGKTTDVQFVPQVIESLGVTHMICVPPLFELMVEGGGPKPLSSLQTVTLAGDRLHRELVRRAASLLPNLEIANEYGVTEASVVSTLLRHQEGEGRISIGRPFGDTELLIVDTNCRSKVVPTGVVGEIAIGGGGLARGYLNRPQLTAGKFVRHAQTNGEIVYLTGDLGRFLADGTIEFLGRTDHQVKIRGNRIEIGEVESRIRRFEGVDDVVVDAVDLAGGHLGLCAFYVASGELDMASLRGYLAEYLPEVMIPSVFMPIDVIPLTATGKVDRSALPGPRRSRHRIDTPFVPPANETEEAIAAIWAEVLGLDSVGVSDNIIDLGGNSINMVKITHTLNHELNLSLPVAILFQYPSVRALSRFILSSSVEEDKDQYVVAPDEKIAIIGMAGRFPGAADVDSFWKNIKNGVESIVFAEADELIEAGLDEDFVAHPSFVPCRGGLLEDKEYFDALFFGYTPREAEVMDPQVRVLHEVAWHALENAGYDSFSYAGTIGVFAGASSNFHWHALSVMSGKSGDLGHFTASQLTDKDFLCTRLAFKLNLEGPAVTVQTSCSTSLVATHMACRSILSGECSMALAGGVSVSAEEHLGYQYQDGMILSKDGHCRAFDVEASGVVGGEGVGMIVLKPLSAAQEEGDHIHAVILASAINNDGNHKAGFTAPGVQGQVGVIKKALRTAAIQPETIGYIEAHGTGTPIGDPIEIQSLIQAFSTEQIGFCAIGSVKTNIGHLDTAAGVAGLIKTVMALQERVLPPSLHYRTPNPAINFERSPFYVNRELEAWGDPQDTLRAGISSFGIGGTNAHIILEQAPPQLETPGKSNPKPCLLPLSAQSPEALDQLSQELAIYMAKHPRLRLEDIAYTLQVGRNSKAHRRTICCKTPKEAVEVLTGKGGNRPATFHATVEDRPIYFLFPGLGSQYKGMARDLATREPLFHATLRRCCDICSGLGIDISQEFFGENGSEPLDVHDFEIGQALMFSVQYSLASLLMEWGIQPRGMMGYSFGEYTAAAVAGVMTPEEALGLIVARGRLVNDCPEGAMLSVPLSAEEAAELSTASTAIAIDNGSSCVLSGPTPDIDLIEKKIKDQRLFATPIKTGRAIHSPMMEPILDEFKQYCQKISFKAPRIPYISNVTGDWFDTEERFESHYWADHLRQTVQFSRGVDKILEQGDALFLEVGPGTDITALLRRRLPEDAKRFGLNMMRPEANKLNDHTYLLNKIGQLWLYGQSIDWRAVFAGGETRRVPLPGYPFQRQRFWIESSVLQEAAQPAARQTEIVKEANMDEWFYWPQWQRTAKLPAIDRRRALESGWLVFADPASPGYEMALHLRDFGADVVWVRIGEEFSIAGENDFVIDPGNREHYLELFKEISHRSFKPRRLIHGFTAMNGDCGLDMGFYSAVYMVKALAKELELDEATIFFLTSGAFDMDGGDEVNPFNGALAGLAKVIPQEYPHLRTRVVDIERSIPDQLIQECLVNSTDTAVAYRNSRRWRQVVEAARFPQPGEGETLLKKKGVYLLTGGLGNIGFILARYLAKEWQADLILVSRSSSPTKLEKIRELEEMDIRVVAAYLDVADTPALKEAVSEAERELGPIDGIIHAAGFVGDGSVKTIDQMVDSDCRKHFAPKIDGTMAIRSLAESRNLDFCLLTSSLSPVLGGVGFAAYAASNAVMDLMAHAFGKESQCHWLSVNWADWRFDEPEDGAIASSIGGEGLKLAMGPDEGIETFVRILSHCTEHQVIVSAGDLDARIDRWVRLESLQQMEGEKPEESKQYYERPILATTYKAPQCEVEQTLTSIWRRFFGFRDVGVDDHFFELGGDSLSAINMMARIHKELNVVIPLQEFFRHPTISGLADLAVGGQSRRHSGILPSEKRDYYPLSAAQTRLCVLQQLDPSGTGYNQHQAVRVEGSLDVERLRQGFLMMAGRHESLRTSICPVGGSWVQVVHDDVDIEFEIIETSPREAEHLITHFIRPFDFERPPFFRVRLLRFSSELHVLVLDMHHIITDGISIGLFLKELMALYQGEILPEPRVQYRDYAQWQQSDQRKLEIEAQEIFWLEAFSGEIPVLQLPIDFPRPAMQSFAGRVAQFHLDEEQSAQLKALARQEGLTLYMVVLGFVNIWLSILSRQEDIVVGTPVAGRGHADLEHVIGMLVNTLALRNFPKPRIPVIDFLREVGRRALQAFDNQDYQFEDLVERVDMSRDTSRNPLFDVKLAMQNVERVGLDVPGLVMTPFGNEITSSKFDLGLDVEDLDGQLRFTLEYCTSLFEAPTIERFIDYFKSVVVEALLDPEKLIGDIQYLNQDQKRIILEEFNNTEKDFPTGIPIHHWLMEWAERTPLRTAVVFEDQSLTYEWLATQARGLAECLHRENGIGAEQPVAVLMERNIRLLPAIFGVLMAGGVYLPLDPHMPEERNRLLMDDAAVKVVLIQDSFIRTGDRLRENCDAVGNVLSVEDYDVMSRNPLPPVDAGQLAYIIYTSGSTGRPKGVMIEHRPVINRVSWMQNFSPLDENDVILHKTPLLFDVSIWELFWWTLAGARVCLLGPGMEKDPTAMIGTISKTGVSTMHFVPSMLQAFMEYCEANGSSSRLGSLRRVFASGEALKPDHCSKFLQLFTDGNHTRLINLYGPTEATVDVSYYDCAEPHPRGIIPIGAPIDNTTLLVMNRQLQLQGVGVPGELCIAGAGLARGYLNRPPQTGTSFPKLPLLEGKRIYRTGDLARFLPDGNIEFLGRIDHQVKIRGFRIELGEIEQCLARVGGFQETVVLLKHDSAGDPLLAAFAKGDPACRIDPLLADMGRQLPSYMVPASLTLLEEIPLTPNGKIDRKALLAIPEGEVKAASPESMNDLERSIADVWSSVLGKEANQFNVTDKFFDVGGHSLKAITMLSRIHKEFDVDIPLTVFFNAPHILGLASYIRGAGKERYSDISPVEKRDFYPMSSTQKRIYFLQQVAPDSTAYNMPETITLEFEPHWTRLRSTFEKLISRHEALRTFFPVMAGDPVQRIHESVTFELEVIEEEIPIEDLIRPFNLAEAPLLRVAAVKRKGGEYVLLVDMHHIVSDGVSHEILEQDFLSLYQGDRLQSLTVQYKDYCLWQTDSMQQEAIERQGAFWLRQFNGDIPVSNLPADFPRPAIRDFSGGSLLFEIDSGTTASLRRLNDAEGMTMFMTLLAAFSILLAKICGQPEVVVGTPVAGRRHPALERVMGMFVNTLAMRTAPEKDKQLLEYIREVRNHVIQAFDNQDFPFDDLVERAHVQRDTGRNPLFDVMFAFHNTKEFERELERWGQDNEPGDGLLFQNQTSKFDMTLTGLEAGDCLYFRLQYNSRLFLPQTVKRFSRYYLRILEGMTGQSSAFIREIEITGHDTRDLFNKKGNEESQKQPMTADFDF
jgi:amino acid adenylation domain-containing protein